MKQNILNNKKKEINAKLYNAHYYDFMLYNGKTKYFSKEYLDGIKIADFSNLNVVNGILYSSINWSGASNSGVIMKDIGFTGIDNGLISFKKDRITNKEFLQLYLNSEMTIETGDTRFFLTPITGNTQSFVYPMSLINDKEQYIALKGGFYQGFFKLDGFNYKVLPDKINSTLGLHFELRPRKDYEVSKNTINNIHPENSGIFFYIGTRAENKFWPFYNYETKLMDDLKKDENILPENKNDIVSLENQWLIPENNTDECNISETSYFSMDDEYICDDCKQYANEDYVGTGVEINYEGYSDSEGHAYNKKGYTEIETNNKFILFNRTSTGYTIDNWKEGTTIKIKDRKDWNNENYFILMNRTDTGYTIDTIDNFNENNINNFNIYKDLTNNVFALRITDEGAIGYRYGIFDEESETKYKVVEEYSKPGLVKNNEWNSVNVLFNKINKKEMKIKIYVNGFLIFISKNIPLFNFKALDDVSQKQETVPYNISLGGGSLGLLETIIPNYYKISEYILPIERDFCGSFIGDIKSFKMYDGFIDYSTIQTYLS